MSSASTSRFGQEKGFVHARATSHAESNHVQKRKRRNKDLEIVFDVNSHRDYVQGFRKRKQQRRKEAVKALEKLSKEQKIEERAERRQAKREQYEKFLPPDAKDSKDEANGGDDVDEDGDELEFDDGSKRQTVKVTAIRTEEDDEFEEQLERRKKALAAKANAAEDDGKGGIRKKMTKKGLSVLNNTKMKLIGKHRFDGAKRKKKVEDSAGGGGGAKSGSGPMKRKGAKRKGRK